MRLREALQRMLAGWQDDLAPPWRAVLGNVELCFESCALDHECWPGERIIPARKTAPPRDAPVERTRSTPSMAFILRKSVRSSSARIRILNHPGPPDVHLSKGILLGVAHSVADSLARIIQVLAFARTHRNRYLAGDRAWSQLIRDARASRVRLEPPRQLFIHLERQ